MWRMAMKLFKRLGRDNMVKIKCTSGRYLRIRQDLNGPYLLLEDSQNEGSEVPSIRVRQKTGFPDTICLFFSNGKKNYLLTVKDANPTLEEVTSFNINSSANPHWFKKVQIGGGKFSLSPVNAPGNHLAFTMVNGRYRNASLSDINYTIFTQ